MSFSFEVRDRDGLARCGSLSLPHGEVETPAFVPVGTLGSVKGMSPRELEEAGASIMLAFEATAQAMGEAEAAACA